MHPYLSLGLNCLPGQEVQAALACGFSVCRFHLDATSARIVQWLGKGQGVSGARNHIRQHGVSKSCEETGIIKLPHLEGIKLSMELESYIHAYMYIYMYIAYG